MNVTTDDDRSRTDALAFRLAGEIDGSSRSVVPFGTFAFCGILFAALLAFSVVFGFVGYRDDLVQVWHQRPFMFKILSMVLAVAGAILWLRRCGTPGAQAGLFPFIVPVLAVLVAGAILDQSRIPATDQQAFSVLKCLAAIVFAAIPPLAVLVLILRRAVPTDLARAGASAGLLAGSLGALAYAPACVNDSFTFVALWYSAAIAITTLIGAALGPWALRW